MCVYVHVYVSMCVGEREEGNRVEEQRERERCQFHRHNFIPSFMSSSICTYAHIYGLAASQNLLKSYIDLPQKSSFTLSVVLIKFENDRILTYTQYM